MEILKVFDAYSIRARLFPAIIAAAPAFAALALLVSWTSFGLSNVIASIGILVLLFAIADLARARGRLIEQKLFADHGGMPSVTMLRRNDGTIDAGSKDRYRAFLAGKLAVAAPSAEDEVADPSTADAFYAQCGNWLRQNTRDPKRFALLFGENVTYGFRRNLLGLRTLALSLNAIVVAICTLLLWRLSWNLDTPQATRAAVVLVVAAAHAAYMLFAVSPATVLDSAKAYGRELLLSCESFMADSTGSHKKPAAKRPAKTPGTASPPPSQQ